MTTTTFQECFHCPCPAGLPCHARVLPAFCDWAATGDEVKLAHIEARSRIAAGQPVAPLEPTPPPRVAFSPAQWRRVQTCPYRQCLRGCQGTKCWWLNRHVRLADCYECLGVTQT